MPNYGESDPYQGPKRAAAGGLAGLLIVIVIAVVVVLCFQGCGAYKDFARHQKVLTAKNNVKVTQVNISKAKQEALITTAQIAATKARAEQRYQEAIGIRRAQDEISKTLTPAYLQHEAIQAQEKSDNATIYIPSGPQGVPLTLTQSAGK